MESFFSDLQDLKTRPAQLSVFMNYLIRSGNPNNLVNDEHNCNLLSIILSFSCFI